MSLLWAQCLETLRRQLPAAEWERYFRPLRGWMDAGTLYVWVDARMDGRRRSKILGQLRSMHEGAIRRVARTLNGGAPIRVRCQPHPPEREQHTNDRRTREHRESESDRLSARCARFRKLQFEEYQKLIAEGIPRLPGTSEQQKRRLLQIIDARALRRLDEREQAPIPIRASGHPARGEPPENPPPWPPRDSKREAARRRRSIEGA